MAWSRLGASRRVLDAVVAVCATALVVSGTSFMGALTATADDAPAPLANPDLVERCGVPVVFVLDASPLAPGGDPALAAALGAVASGAANELAGRGSTLGVLAYDGSARWLTDPVHPGLVDDAALGSDGPLAAALAAYATTASVPGEGSGGGGRNWAAALTAARATLGAVPDDQPALILHVTTGAPLDGPDDPNGSNSSNSSNGSNGSSCSSRSDRPARRGERRS